MIKKILQLISKPVKHLSISIKQKYLPLIIKRDGENCLYCGKKLNHKIHIYEHLNDNRRYNGLENIVLACQSCNNKKLHDSDMQKLALEKLNANQKSNFMRERKFGDETDFEASTEIEINVSNYDITEQYIGNVIDCYGFVLYSEALNSSVALCKEKTGHGSQQSVRNYIAALTSTLGCFEITRDENRKKIILRREGR